MLLQLDIKKQKHPENSAILIEEEISIIVTVIGYQAVVDGDADDQEWLLDHNKINYHGLPEQTLTRACLHRYVGGDFYLMIENYDGETDEDYPHFQIRVSEVKSVANFPVPTR